MAELVAVIVSFPAVVPTVLLGVVLLYWVMVVVGVLDVDFMSGEGAADGVLEGVQGVDALVQGAPDAAVEGIV
ncbi:MAG TPA: glycine zipper family protein, partial [Polyangiaceae bacterium]|nr:glycine zipper family protein [Polyangiaceae bacterium]